MYTYDVTNTLKSSSDGSTTREFVYTAADERLAIDSHPANNTTTGTWTWTIRDLGQNVQREYASAGATGGSSGSWSKDYVWRDGLLRATETPNNIRLHFHLDHLGTPRLVTNQSGTTVGQHDYYPFGTETASSVQESPQEAIKFAGHEWDSGDINALTYIHARSYSAAMGRFLSVDRVLGKPEQPQSWNRYAYVTSEPLAYVDPTGQVIDLASLTSQQRADVLQGLNDFTGNTYDVDGQGDLVAVSYGPGSSTTASQFLASAIAASDVYTVKGAWGDKSILFAQTIGHDITVDFKDFTAMDYGGIDPRSFGIGSNVIHELIHAHNGADDGPAATRDKVPGPVEDYVNQMRAERGFALRAAYTGTGTVDAHGQPDRVRIPIIVHR